jgi:hypothetical protein
LRYNLEHDCMSISSASQEIYPTIRHILSPLLTINFHRIN